MTSLWTFVRIALTSICTGSGIGAMTAWFMTTRLEREYQMAITETGVVLGAAAGFVLGCIAYYLIFQGKMDFLTFGTVTSTTAIISAVSAFLLHTLTGTGGWLALPLGIIAFIGTCLRARVTQKRTTPETV